MRHSCLTLLCATLCLTPVAGQTPEQGQTTIAYLQACQQPDGGFLPAKAGGPPNGAARSSLRASTAALRALKYFGGEPRDRMACARFIPRCWDQNSGGFADQPGGQPDVVSTAVGLMAVVELKVPLGDYRDAAISYLAKHVQSFEDIRIGAAGLEAVGAGPRLANVWVNVWLKEIAKLRHADGTYGTGAGVARATGGAVVAVLRLGGTVEQKENVLRALKAGQRPDGAFGKEGAQTSDLESCYRVVRAFVMLQDRPDAQRCRTFVAKCRNPDGGYGIIPGQASSVGATYFAAIILHWLR